MPVYQQVIAFTLVIDIPLLMAGIWIAKSERNRLEKTIGAMAICLFLSTFLFLIFLIVGLLIFST